MNKIIIDRKTMERAGIFERLKQGDITHREAAERLGWSVRWVREQLKRYRKSGAEGLIHGNTGKSNPRKIPANHVDLALDLLRSRLQGAGPTYLAEKLLEIHGVKINEESMRQIMIRNNEWAFSRARPKHRQRRERRAQVGIMVQLDGSPHDWFEGRGPRCTLLVFIDDATSRILWLEFVTGESVDEVMKATANYLKKFGRPTSFYVDHGSVWSVNVNNSDGDKKTQFERAMAELDIEIIHANSPQAKGRVERSNQTLQDRLIKDMRLEKISSREAANKFAQNTYIPKHNELFSVAPAEPVDAHRSLDGFNLYNIMSKKTERVIAQDYVITHGKQLFQLSKHQSAVIRPKERVTVSNHLDGKISISIRKIQLNFTRISSRPMRIIPPKPARPERHYKPAPNHPWRTPFPLASQHFPAPASARSLATSAGQSPSGELGGTPTPTSFVKKRN